MNKESIINHPKIKKVIEEYQLNAQQIESGIYIFMQMIEENEHQDNDFMTSIEIYDENNIVAITIPNEKKIKELKRNKYHWLSYITKINPNLNFDHVSANKTISNPKQLNKNIFYWSIPNLNINNRGDVALWFKQFYKEYKKNNTTSNIKGFYLWGDFSLGKTMFMNAFANYLITKSISVAFLNSIDLYEYLKQFLNDTKTDQTKPIINMLKNVECLLIDNIGSEKQNEWFLFSILLPVLEARISENKLTCFCSNLSISQLEKYYISAKLDRIKTRRLIDRIETLTSKIRIIGNKIKL